LKRTFQYLLAPHSRGLIPPEKYGEGKEREEELLPTAGLLLPEQRVEEFHQRHQKKIGHVELHLSLESHSYPDETEFVNFTLILWNCNQYIVLQGEQNQVLFINI
jgi:hypothetical protein